MGDERGRGREGGWARAWAAVRVLAEAAAGGTGRRTGAEGLGAGEGSGSGPGPGRGLMGLGRAGTGGGTKGGRSGNFRTVRSDAEFRAELEMARREKKFLVVEFGTQYCRACKSMVSVMSELSRAHPKAQFLVAQCEQLPETTQNVRYTPTFRFYKEGNVIDECIGAEKQSLRDHIWLQLTQD